MMIQKLVRRPNNENTSIDETQMYKFRFSEFTPQQGIIYPRLRTLSNLWSYMIKILHILKNFPQLQKKYWA